MKLTGYIKPASAFLLLFFAASFLIRTDNSFDQDLGRHLLLGQIIWETKEVPLTNLFSYTYPDFPFINSHWLFELLLYLGQQTVGLSLLIVFKVTTILLAIWLVLMTVPKNRYLLLPLAFIFLHTVRERPDLRPEVLSFLFTGLTLFILTKFEEGKSKWIYLLPLIQLLWVNSHIYFMLGLFLQAIFLVHVAYKTFKSQLKSETLKVLGVVFFFSIIAGLINPSGLKGFLNPLTFNQNYGYTIAENQNMFLLESLNFRNPNFLFVKIAIIIAFLSLVIAFFKNRLSPKTIGLTVLGVGIALLNIRSFPYLFLISLPAILENFGGEKFTLIHKILLFITIPVLLYESISYLNGDYYRYTDQNTQVELTLKENGKNALDFVLGNNLPQPIFNNFDIGSYITYRGYPKYRIFVDGRPGEYPASFFRDEYIPAQEDPGKFTSLEKKYNFQTIIFSHTDQTPWARKFLKSITQDPKWSTVFIDNFIIVLVREDVAQQKNLAAINLDKITPEKFDFQNHVQYLRLSLFLLNLDYVKTAENFAQGSRQIFPDSPSANLILANIYGTSGDYIQLLAAREYFRKSSSSIFW